MLITCRWGIRGALCAVTASIIISAQTVVFIPQTNIAAGLNPVSLAIGDFRGDRKPDLAVAAQGSATVPILLGLGNGFFQPLENLGVGIGPRAVAVGDFNRDGRLDLVVANFGSETVSLLLGNGNGTFRQGVTLEASGPSAVAVGDFNADGKLDLAVTNRNNNNVSIFLGIGEGFFLPPLNFAVGVGPVSIAPGDFNADGKADLVVANETSNSVSVLLGNGNGTFQPALNFAAGLMPVSIALGDFNSDGKIDLAVVNATSTGTISLLLGNGRGIFQAALSFIVGANPSFVVSADFNLDGKLDLAVANAGSNTVSVLMGTGRGIFLPGLDFATGDGPAWIGVTDLNADGKPDLMVANRLSSTVSVLINRTLVRDQPTIADRAVLNAASYQTSFLAPGELVTIFGSNLGPTQPAGPQLNASHRVDTTLAQTRVLFDGIPAPLIYVRADQVSAIVPYAVAGHFDTQVAVERNQVMSPALTIPVSESAPGLFTANASGKGPGAILNEDLSINSAANPAARGSIVVLYGTGAGQTNPPGVDGELAGKVPPKPALPVSVTIDGKKAQVLYAGAIQGVPAAVIQVNVRLPDGIHSGSVPVFLNVGGAASQQGVTVAVQ